jgi:hypothetical protein
MLQVCVPLLSLKGKAWFSLVRVCVRSMRLEILGDQKVVECYCQRYTALLTILCTPATHLLICFGQLALVRFASLTACSGRCHRTNQCYNHAVFRMLVQKQTMQPLL